MTQPGDCAISVHYAGLDDRIGRLRVDHADPVVWITAELLNEMRNGDHHPDVEIDGDLLTIRATNRTVIYRIGRHDPEQRAYLMSWPD